MKPKFWTCGEKSGLGCGCECWSLVSYVLQIKQPGKRKQGIVFCSKCAQKILAANKEDKEIANNMRDYWIHIADGAD